MSTTTEDVEGLVYRILVDGAMLDVVFDLVRSLKVAETPFDELCAPRETEEIHMEVADATMAMKQNPRLYDRISAFRDSTTDFRCAHCGQKVNALRYAPHLDKCMGKGYVLFFFFSSPPPRRGRRGTSTTRKLS